MKRTTLFLFFGIIAGIIFTWVLFRTTVVNADQEPKVYWCHCEPNGKCETLHISMNALIQAGHVNANGNPLHAGDHSGACTEPTATPTLTPTIKPTPVECDDECVTGTPTPTPSPTATPRPTPIPTPFVGRPQNGPGDGRSDGLGGKTYAALVCSGVFPDKPLLQHFVRVAPDAVELGWWAPVSGANKYSLEYWYYGDALHMGVPEIPGNVTQFTVRGLQVNRPINAVLWAWLGECVTKSDTIDP